MKALVVYYSMFGNTHKVAEAIAAGLQTAAGSNGTIAVLNLEQLTAADLGGAELVVMGSPTHRANLPEAVRQALAGLPRRSLRGKAVAAFDTSYKMGAFLSNFTASKKLLQKLRSLGGRRVVSPETFYVLQAHEGPLYEGETERARAWAGTILEKSGLR